MPRGPVAKRPRRKPTAEPRIADAPPRKLNVRLSARAYELLSVHAMRARRNRGDLLTELIETQLSRYQVRDLGRDDAEDAAA